MKKYFLFLALLSGSPAYTQQRCGCAHNPDLQLAVSCTPTIFRNGARLYWQYDCDRSDLVFRSPSGREKSIFFLDNGLMDMAGRLGIASWKEYENGFIAEYRVISGCCEPQEYHLYDKTTGRFLYNLGFSVGASDKINLDIFLEPDGSKLNIYNGKSGRLYYYSLPLKEVQAVMYQENYRKPDALFQLAGYHKGNLVIRMQVLGKTGTTTKTRNIYLDPKKYR